MKKKYFLVFLLLVILSACSRLDLAVNLANSYLTNKADDYFDLTRQQTSWLKEALDRDITKVKKSIFPQLATEMYKAAEVLSIQRQFDASLLLSTYERLENLFYQGLRLFSADAVAFVDQLGPTQISHFQKELEKKLKDLKDEPEKKSYDRIKKQFDSWTGTMTSDQKKELKQFIASNPPPVQETVYNRQEIGHGFIRSFPDKGARRKYVDKLFNQYESLCDPSYLRIVKEKNKRVAGFVAALLNKMSSDQKKTLIETIRDRANQIVKISKG